MLAERGVSLEEFRKGPRLGPAGHFGGIMLDAGRINRQDPELAGRDFDRVIVAIPQEDLEPGWHATETGVFVFGPVPGRILTAQFTGTPVDRQAPITEAELEASIRHVAGVEVNVHGIRSATRFTDNARQVPAYRLGRVLLAGDTAHVHSPFGGQGLNLGLGDAMNLGWKLAAVCHGEQGEELLDTYTAERHPIGAWVLEWTRAQIDIMRPEPHARAMRAVTEALAETVDGTTYFAKRISGVWQRYDLGGSHPLVGACAPAAAGYAERLRILTAPLAAPEPAPALLVRPDGYVAWAAASEGAPGDAGEGLAQALRSWLDAPTPSSAEGRVLSIDSAADA
jgi:hypothetical protein